VQPCNMHGLLAVLPLSPTAWLTCPVIQHNPGPLCCLPLHPSSIVRWVWLLRRKYRRMSLTYSMEMPKVLPRWFVQSFSAARVPIVVLLRYSLRFNLPIKCMSCWHANECPCNFSHKMHEMMCGEYPNPSQPHVDSPLVRQSHCGVTRSCILQCLLAVRS
jgi:hypothetical protein